MSDADLTCSAGWLLVQAVRFGNIPNPTGRQKFNERKVMQAQCSATVSAWAVRRSAKRAFLCLQKQAKFTRSRAMCGRQAIFCLQKQGVCFSRWRKQISNADLSRSVRRSAKQAVPCLQRRAMFDSAVGTNSAKQAFLRLAGGAKNTSRRLRKYEDQGRIFVKLLT